MSLSALVTMDNFVPEVGVLEQDARVLLVDAHGVLEGAYVAVSPRELGVQVVYGALEVTAPRQDVGHIAGAVLAEVEGVLALVRVLRVAAVRGVSALPMTSSVELTQGIGSLY